MRMLRSVLLVIAAVVATFGISSVAHADPYPIGDSTAQVSDGSVAAGSAVRFSGSGFGANELVRITAGGRLLKTVRASADGTFSTTVELSGAAGRVTLSATGVESGVVVTANVRVAAAGGDGGDMDVQGDAALPTTGTSLRQMAGVVYGGTGAVLLGAGLLWFARRRKRADA